MTVNRMLKKGEIHEELVNEEETDVPKKQEVEKLDEHKCNDTESRQSVINTYIGVKKTGDQLKENIQKTRNETKSDKNSTKI